MFEDIKLVMQSNKGIYYTKNAPVKAIRSKFVFYEEPTFFDSQIVVTKLENTFIRQNKENKSETMSLEERLYHLEQKIEQLFQTMIKQAN